MVEPSRSIWLMLSVWRHWSTIDPNVQQNQVFSKVGTLNTGVTAYSACGKASELQSPKEKVKQFWLFPIKDKPKKTIKQYKTKKQNHLNVLPKPLNYCATESFSNTSYMLLIHSFPLLRFLIYLYSLGFLGWNMWLQCGSWLYFFLFNQSEV